MQLSAAILLSLALTASGAAAHEIGAQGDSDFALLLSGWTSDAATLVPMAIALFWYAAGVQRVIAEGKAATLAPSRLLAFAGGLIVLVIALQSPIDAISEDLFSVHMVQHLLLMLAAPPLLVWSDYPMMFLRALPRRGRKAIARFWAGSSLAWIYGALMHPLVVWMLFCGAFVFWHAPAPYQWALDHTGIHVLEHLSFFITSLAFWSIVLPPRGHRRRLQHGPVLLLVVATAVLSGLPGALMIFAPRPLYPGHAEGVAKWGLSLMEDQEIAGLLMWIPAGAAYLLAVALVFLAWLREAEARALKAAQRGAALLLAISVVGSSLAPRSRNDAAPLANFIAQWIETPQQVLPRNARLLMGMSHREARDIHRVPPYAEVAGR